MKRWIPWIATAGLFSLFGSSASAELAVGDAAPDFSLAGSDGRTYTLRDYAGKQGVVIAWFPKAFTPG